MLSIDRIFNGLVLVGPLIAGALLTGVIFAGEDGTTLPVTIFQFSLVLCFALFFCKKVMERTLSLQLYGAEAYYLIFVGIIFFSIIYSPAREGALLLATRFVVLLLMTYLIYNSINDVIYLKKVCYTAISVGIIIATYNLIQTYFNPEIAAFNYASQGAKLVRSSGGELDPNIFASNYFLPLLLMITFFSRAKKFMHRIFLFAGIGLMIGSVLLTYSRSAWVSLGVGVFCIIYMTRDYKFILYMLISFLVFFAVSETIQQLTFSFLERLINIFAGSSDDSSRFRIILAVTSIYMIMDSYLLGVGFYGFASVFKTYHPPETTQGIFDPHNEYYSVFAELGIHGMIVFLLILVYIGRAARNNIRLSEDKTLRSVSIALFATFVSYLIFYNFLGGMLKNSILFIVIGLIFVVQKLLSDNAVNKKPALDNSY